MADKRFYHELSKEEVRVLIGEKRTWGYAMKHFKQPSWCHYPKELIGTMGCWALVGMDGDETRLGIKDGCPTCDLSDNYDGSMNHIIGKGK